MMKRSALVGVPMRRGALARAHDLHAGIEQPNRRADVLEAGVDQHHHAPPGLLGLHQFQRTQHGGAHMLPLPQHGHAGGHGMPRLDLVCHRPQRAHLARMQVRVVALQLRRVVHVGAAGDVLLHGAVPLSASEGCGWARFPSSGFAVRHRGIKWERTDRIRCVRDPSPNPLPQGQGALNLASPLPLREGVGGGAARRMPSRKPPRPIAIFMAGRVAGRR